MERGEVFDLCHWHGADVDKRSDIVHAIIQNRRTKHLQDIVDTGWDVNEALAIDLSDSAPILVRRRRTALQLAVIKPAWTEGVRLLITAGANPNLRPEALDPLTMAVSQGRIDDQLGAVKLLLAHGADPNGANQLVEDSPLVYAIKFSNDNDFDTRIVDLLLENGADPNLIKAGLLPWGYCSKVPIYLALDGLQLTFSNLKQRQERDINVTRTFIRREIENAKKTSAALFGSLVRCGADVNWNISLVNLDVRVIELYCRSILQRLVLPFYPQEQYEFLQEHLDLLYKARCDIERRDVHNRSALESVVRECGNSNTVRWLIRHGADTTCVQFRHLHGLLIPRKVRSWYVHGFMSQYAPRLVWNETPLILIRAGMIIPKMLHLHLIVIQQAIQAFLAIDDPDEAAEASLHTEIRDQWDQIVEADALEMKRIKSRTRNPSAYNYERTQQMAYLEEFSDESLYVYPEDEYTRNPNDQWQYSLKLINKILAYISKMHSLQWWCRRCLRDDLECLAPSAIKAIQIPAILKRYVLCHEL